MDAVRVGLIGCGVIGRTHAKPAVESPRLELVAVADLIPERAQAYAAEFSIPQVYTAGDDLIDQAEVDLIVLALPCGGRHSLGLHALAQGRHLLTEKPVAMSAAQLRELIAARGDLQAACCSSRFRFTESAKVVTEFIATGKLGDLRVLRARNVTAGGPPPASAPPEWRLKKHLNGGGILMNWGCYDLDYLLGITGWSLQPVSAFAQIWPVTDTFAYQAAPGSEAETHLTALIRFSNGAVLTYERGEFVAGRTENTWSIHGTTGALQLNPLPWGNKALEFDAGVSGTGVVSETLWSGGDRPEDTSNGPITDLARAIQEGGEPSTTLERALVVQQISDAIYESAASGQLATIA